MTAGRTRRVMKTERPRDLPEQQIANSPNATNATNTPNPSNAPNPPNACNAQTSRKRNTAPRTSLTIQGANSTLHSLCQDKEDGIPLWQFENRPLNVEIPSSVPFSLPGRWEVRLTESGERSWDTSLTHYEVYNGYLRCPVSGHGDGSSATPHHPVAPVQVKFSLLESPKDHYYGATGWRKKERIEKVYREANLLAGPLKDLQGGIVQRFYGLYSAWVNAIEILVMVLERPGKPLTPRPGEYVADDLLKIHQAFLQSLQVFHGRNVVLGQLSVDSVFCRIPPKQLLDSKTAPLPEMRPNAACEYAFCVENAEGDAPPQTIVSNCRLFTGRCADIMEELAGDDVRTRWGFRWAMEKNKDAPHFLCSNRLEQSHQPQPQHDVSQAGDRKDGHDDAQDEQNAQGVPDGDRDFAEERPEARASRETRETLDRQKKVRADNRKSARREGVKAAKLALKRPKGECWEEEEEEWEESTDGEELEAQAERDKIAACEEKARNRQERLLAKEQAKEEWSVRRVQRDKAIRQRRAAKWD